MIKETIELEVNGVEVNILHKGVEAHTNWSQDSKVGLQEWVEELINKGETSGWLPFANFEASVEFDLVTGVYKH
tara:strand:- start:1782 stop:2003 length:222 start_codon:yes stop_codon:yes gene_type:complete